MVSDARPAIARLNSNLLWGFQNRPLFGSNTIVPSSDWKLGANNDETWDRDMYSVSHSQNQTYEIIDPTRYHYATIDPGSIKVCR